METDVWNTDMPAPSPGAIDQGTTRLAPGIMTINTRAQANVTRVKGLSGSVEGCGVAVGLGNGEIGVFSSAGNLGPHLKPHDAAVTGFADQGDTLFSIAQDGRLSAHDLKNGKRNTLFTSPGEWLSSLVVARNTGMVAFAVGKKAIVLPTAQSESGAQDFEFDNHPSSVSGLAFSPDGKRLAVSHYDGVTLWSLDGSDEGVTLCWKGFHIAVSWSPDGRFVVSATQERELHVWDLVTDKDFRLGGYPAKPHMLDWTTPETGPVQLVCSGADVVTAWPFGDVGPGRLPPVEIGYVYTGRVTAVAPHPTRPLVAGGYTTGTVLIGGLQKGEAAFARIADDETISGLDWVGASSNVLAVGTRGGSLDFITIGELRLQ